MLFSLLHCSLLLSSALVFANKYTEHNGFDHAAKAISAVEGMQPVDWWRLFRFTNVGAPALTRYEFVALTPFNIEITDIYCTGDIFLVFNSGVPLGQTSIPEVAPTCLNTTSDPEVALANPAYSSGSGPLPSGYYNLTITAVVSPWTAGSGAIRFQPNPSSSEAE